MTSQLTAMVGYQGDGYVARRPEVDVASRGEAVAEARRTLEEALIPFFETASPNEVEMRRRSEVLKDRRRGRSAG